MPNSLFNTTFVGVTTSMFMHRDADIFSSSSHVLIVFYGFCTKPRAWSLSILMLENTWECDRAHFYHFFGLKKVIRKRNPPGVLFKLFSDCLNMKILPSDLAIFTLVKVFEEIICWEIIYLFFGLIRLFYEKGIERVLF